MNEQERTDLKEFLLKITKRQDDFENYVKKEIDYLYKLERENINIPEVRGRLEIGTQFTEKLSDAVNDELRAYLRNDIIKIISKYKLQSLIVKFEN